MSSRMSLTLSFMVLLLLDCSAPQRPYRFNLVATVEDPLQLVSRELTAQGLSPARIDAQQGTLWTNWEDTGFLYGDGTLVRRYLVVVGTESTQPTVTLRAEVYWCLRGGFTIQADQLFGDCRRMEELESSHQEDLDALGVQIKEALSGHLATATPEAQPEASGNVLAVFDVQDASRTISSSVLEQMTELLSVKLTEYRKFKIIPRNQIRERLREQQKESYQHDFDQSSQIELGKAMAASKLLATTLLRVQDACTLTAVLYDIKTETSDQSVSVNSPCSDQELLAGVTKLAKQLSR